MSFSRPRLLFLERCRFALRSLYPIFFVHCLYFVGVLAPPRSEIGVSSLSSCFFLGVCWSGHSVNRLSIRYNKRQKRLIVPFCLHFPIYSRIHTVKIFISNKILSILLTFRCCGGIMNLSGIEISRVKKGCAN